MVDQPPSAPLPSGLVYGDVPNRIIAYIIDILVLAVINIAVGIVLGIIGFSVVVGTGLDVRYDYLASIVFTVVGLAISGGYFIYSWTNQRSTLGMRALGLQIGTAPNGETITTDQAVRRWLALGAIFSIAQMLNPLPFIGFFLSLATIAWVIFLLYTTAVSPTKQGWHDVFANTMVVKTAPRVG